MREKQTLLPLLIQEEELLSRYGSDHPRVKTVRRSLQEARSYLRTFEEFEKEFNLTIDPEEIEQLREEYVAAIDRYRRELLRSYVDSLQQQLAEAQENFKNLDDLYRQEEEQAIKLAGYQTRDESFRKDIERTSQLFNGVLANLDRITLSEDSDGYNYRVIAAPGLGIKTAPSAS